MDNFVVSARKYRPATFISVVGQNHITSTLKNAIARNQLAHAYLFCGPRGVGKTTCARIFAKAINCLSPVDVEACNECESCKSFNEGRSFNIHELDAASNNSVDDIRSLTDQVRIPPQIGKYSVYIIDEVHMLSSAAFNAFLKTLEEPPVHAIFILATTEKHKIIPTILSRCQIFDFNRIRVEDSVSYLKFIAEQEKITYDDESLHLISIKADGGMRDALSMFDKAVSFCGSDLNFKQVAQTLNILDYDTYFTVTSLILKGDYPQTLTLFDEVLRKGFSGQVFITGMNSHLRDILMCKSPQTTPLLEVTGTLLERYKQQGADCDVGFLFESIALLTALDGTLRTSTNQRLSVELGLMKLCGLGQKKNEPTAVNPFLITQVPALPPLLRPSEAVSLSNTIVKAASVETVVPLSVSNRQMTEQSAQAQSSVGSDDPAIPSIPARSSGGNGLSTRSTSTPFSISGVSISSIMKSSKSDVEQQTEAESESVEANIDPKSEEKITQHMDEFMTTLKRERPRIAMALHGVRVSGNTLIISVPNESLHEDIMRNRSEMLSMLAVIANVQGTINLDVTVVEDTTARKPIKVEDKLRFLVEKNPVINILRKELDLDIE